MRAEWASPAVPVGPEQAAGPEAAKAMGDGTPAKADKADGVEGASRADRENKGLDRREDSQ